MRIRIRLFFRHFYTIVFRPTIPFGRVKVHARTPEAPKESKSSFRLNPKNPYVEVDSSDSNLF